MHSVWEWNFFYVCRWNKTGVMWLISLVASKLELKMASGYFCIWPAGQQYLSRLTACNWTNECLPGCLNMAAPALPSELDSLISKQWPCRELQIRQLAGLLSVCTYLSSPFYFSPIPPWLLIFILRNKQLTKRTETRVFLHTAWPSLTFINHCPWTARVGKVDDTTCSSWQV